MLERCQRSLFAAPTPNQPPDLTDKVTTSKAGLRLIWELLEQENRTHLADVLCDQRTRSIFMQQPIQSLNLFFIGCLTTRPTMLLIVLRTSTRNSRCYLCATRELAEANIRANLHNSNNNNNNRNGRQITAVKHAIDGCGRRAKKQ